jgi:hypothetical protein
MFLRDAQHYRTLAILQKEVPNNLFEKVPLPQRMKTSVI